MTTHRELRQKLKAWFEYHIRVDEWTAEPPRGISMRDTDEKIYPANTAMMGPYRDVIFQRATDTYGNLGDYELIASVPFVLVFRFSGELSQDQLPLFECETLHSALSAKWIMGNDRGGSGLFDELVSEGREVDEVDGSPVTIGKLEDAGEDWIVVLSWSLRFQAILEPSPSGLQQPREGEGEDVIIPLQEINLGLWRSYADGVAPSKLVFPTPQGR